MQLGWYCGTVQKDDVIYVGSAQMKEQWDRETEGEGEGEGREGVEVMAWSLDCFGRRQCRCVIHPLVLRPPLQNISNPPHHRPTSWDALD